MAALAIEYQPLTTILLYGQLRQFGRSFQMSVRTPAEAIKALCVQIPGFERFLSGIGAALAWDFYLPPGASTNGLGKAKGN